MESSDVIQHLYSLVRWKRPQRGDAGLGRSTHLGVVVEVPQVQVSHAVHAGEQGGVSGRPHHVVHVVRAVLERVQRLVVLRDGETEQDTDFRISCCGFAEC